MNIIGCKWVFQLKTKSNGIIDQYKAQLMAKGFNQEGLDFSHTFSSVIRRKTIQMVLSIAMSHSWPIM